MNAQLRPSVAGTMISHGSMPAATPVPARTGIITFATAVLLVISVMNVANRATKPIIAHNGRLVSGSSAFPRSRPRPGTWKAWPMAMPPPIMMNTPQGIRAAPSHVRSAPSWSPPRGMRNIATTEAMATLLSPAVPETPSSPAHPPKGSLRVTHATAVIAKTMTTRRSSDRHGPSRGSSALPRSLVLRVSHTAVSGSMTATSGTPMRIHSSKLTSVPVASCY